MSERKPKHNVGTDTEKTPYKDSISEQYDKMMSGFSNQKWEKRGDFYEQFSLYDTSMYDTSTSSNVII